ncbi:phosphohistidine phosphatase [Nonlabens dokdonensis]|uniref:Phosphoglycerate/bisphosphoglycerate mutase n=2 Tax=Nonlabens dokdonensis TaxID=328515 RepID=L7WCB4_NONDD|nr:histidine phosphatase family protein [Nonlabens dokdonensis]AGC77734.1 phosphoglycerate/bisphosphoglycerate mutase [Nonlabens dokdonensis DSW-6]PZX39730.1 phosphohistidine phosphatase [Nonlabens dokdonensis]
MKRLIIIRHGKSSWDLQVRDHDRVLKQRGIDDAHLIGQALKDMDFNPDVIWTSTAARALQTATLVSEYINYDLSKLKLKRELYTFDSRDLSKIIKDCDNAIDTLVIFSHNHGITDLVNDLGTTRFDNVPTTGVVAIEFMEDSWRSINKGITKFNLFPKDIR